MTTEPSINDRHQVEALLGRAPQGDFEVVVRDSDEMPVVIRNAPFLHDGTPMPTRYWLVGERERLLVGRLEAAGGVRAAEADIPAAAIADAHAAYAAERDADIPASHTGPRPEGGVGGTRRGLKCLHAHYAWFLAGGPDPVGQWVADRLATVDDQPAEADPTTEADPAAAGAPLKELAPEPNQGAS